MTRARMPSGSWVTKTVQWMDASVATRVAGIHAFDASSVREASVPRNPVAVE